MTSTPPTPIGEHWIEGSGPSSLACHCHDWEWEGHGDPAAILLLDPLVQQSWFWHAVHAAAPSPSLDETLAQVYEDGMRAGIIAGRAGRDFEDALAEVNALVEDTDTEATATAIRRLSGDEGGAG